MRCRLKGWGRILAALLLFSSGALSWAEDDFSSRLQTNPPPPQALLSPLPAFGDAAFLSRWSSADSEYDKIRYLLDRIGNSSNSFIRNGLSYDGKKARAWLLYKRSHWVKGNVDTAEDFIEKVAAFSQKTKKPYLVEFSDGTIYPLKSILQNELLAFNHYRSNPPSFYLSHSSNESPKVAVPYSSSPPSLSSSSRT